MAKNKRLAAAAAQVDRTKSYPLEEAIALIKSVSKAKFDETVEMSMNLGIDSRHADQMVRGLTSLPNGTGKAVRVGVFARGPKAEEATAALNGARQAGAEIIQAIESGNLPDGIKATPIARRMAIERGLYRG